MKRFVLLATVLTLILVLAIGGCGKDPAESGGVIRDSDETAPKEIRSKDIVSFSVNIFLYGEWSEGREDSEYTFEVRKNEKEVLTASESTTSISALADEELLKTLQGIIDEYKLAEQNGEYVVRAGLPPEFSPCTLNVDYESGENLRFTVNNNPDGDWEKDIYLAFAGWFASKGEEALLPPLHNGPIERIAIIFKEKGMFYRYGVWKVKNEGEEGEGTYSVVRDVYDDEKGETVYDDRIPIPEDYFNRISEIVSSYDIRAFDPYSVYYGRGRIEPEEERDPWDEDLRIDLDYEDGRTVNIGTSVPEDIETLRPMLNDLFEYHDSLFE